MPHAKVNQQASLPVKTPNIFSDTNSKKISIIIADDNADDQYLILQAIKSIDKDVEHAAVFNGTQLVELLTNKGVYATSYKYSPNAIILDLNMPVMDGLTALKIIRRLEKFRSLPIYILHTSRFDDYLNQCSELGVEGIYTKPAKFLALQLIIENIYYSCGGVRKTINN